MTDSQRLRAVEKIIQEVYQIKLDSYQMQRDKRETWTTYRRRVKKLARLEVKLFRLFVLDITALGYLVQPSSIRK